MGIVYDKSIKAGKYEVKISTKEKYGFFEHDDYGEDDGGSFELENKEVDDIDGCYAIPVIVADAIIKLGFKIDKDLYCCQQD